LVGASSFIYKPRRNKLSIRQRGIFKWRQAISFFPLTWIFGAADSPSAGTCCSLCTSGWLAVSSDDLRDRRAKMRSREGQMQCGGTASPGQSRRAQRSASRCETKNIVSLAVARSDPDVPPVTANVLPLVSEHATLTDSTPPAPGTWSRYGSPLKSLRCGRLNTSPRENAQAAAATEESDWCDGAHHGLSTATAAVSMLRSGNVVVERPSDASLEGLGNLGGHLLGEFGEFFGLRDHRIELLARMCGRQCNELRRGFHPH
jgi:hypothetical protein